MMKFFYKTLLISLISGSLSTLNLVAYAQDAAANSSATAQMSQADNSGLTRDANGVVKKTESHSFSGTQNDNALHVITMLAVGVIGTKLLMYKKWTLDMSVVAAASAAYIASELMNIMNLKSDLKNMNVEITKSSDGKVDQTQIETLEKLKQSYEKVKKSAQTKKKLQQAAAAAFAGATGIAAYQRLSEEGKYASCEAGIVSALTELGTCSAAGKAAAATIPVGTALVAAGLQCDSCITQVSALQKILTAYKPKKEIPGMSMAKFLATEPELDSASVMVATACADPATGAVALGIKSSFVTPACSTYLADDKLNKAYGLVDNTVTQNPNNLMGNLDKMLFASSIINPVPKMSIDSTMAQRNLLQKMVDAIFPRAEAGMISMFGLGAGALAAFYSAKLGIGTTLDTWMFTPGGRIIAWGIMTAAALMGASATQSEIDKIDGNIAKIDQILKDLGSLKSGVKANNVNEQQIQLAAFKANENQSIPLNPDANTKTDCLASSGDSSCAPLSDKIKSMPGFANLPDSFKSIASQSAKLGDGLSGTNSISGSTLATADSLGSKQAAISKLANSVKSKLNDNLSKAGKPKIDFDKQEKDLWAQLKSQTGKALKSKGMSGGAFLANTGISPISSSAMKSSSTASSSKKASGVAVSAVAASTSSKDKENEFKLDLGANTTEGSNLGSDGAGAKDPKFDIGSNDVNTNSGDSIFQVISNRYIKSAYPKLFDVIPEKN